MIGNGTEVEQVLPSPRTAFHQSLSAIHFGDVSEALGPFDPNRFGRLE